MTHYTIDDLRRAERLSSAAYQLIELASTDEFRDVCRRMHTDKLAAHRWREMRESDPVLRAAYFAWERALRAELEIRDSLHREGVIHGSIV